MVFAHGKQPPSLLVDSQIAVEVTGWRQRRRLGAARLAIEALVDEVREVHVALVSGHRGPAVLVHARANVEAGGRDVQDSIVGGSSYDDVASSLRRASFGPVQIVAVDREVAKAERTRGHAGGGQR